VRIGFVDPDGREVSPDGMIMVSAYPPPGENEP
jgi:hypothetical protein